MPIWYRPNPNGMGGFSAPVAAPVAAGVVQHVASAANPEGLGITGNAFKIPLPNAVGAGNCLVLGITYPNGSTPTITDNNGNTWPGSPSVSADAGAGNYVAAIFVLPNANAGQTLITVTFGAAIIPFQYTLTESNNIATASPVNGTKSATSVTGPNLATGSFTPTANNDANGGNLIWSYFAPSRIHASNPSSWSAGSGFTLLDADRAWINNQGVPHASQWQVQAAQAAVNPGATATGDTGTYNCVAVALKVASAGTAIPAGIHVNKTLHQTTASFSGSIVLQFPTTGNLRVITANEPSPVINITSVVDSESVSWTKINPSTDEPQIWYRPNVSANPNLTVTITISGTAATTSFRCYDIQGAAASPVGATAGHVSTTVNNLTAITAYPSITPQQANGLVIARTSLGQGPGLAVTSPSGAVFDLVTYTGEQDTDLMENADCEAIIYNTGTSALSFDWTITSRASNTASGVAAEFKAA